MLKKLMLLAMAAMALVAVAAPAAAQAEAHWTDDGKPITTDHEVEFTGPAGFLVPGVAGAHAIVHAEITLSPDTGTGTVDAFHVTQCTGTGQLNNLPCTATPTFMSWPVQATANGTILITIPSGAEGLHNIYYANGAHTIPVATTVLEGDIIATPDASGEIGSVSLEGGENLTANGNTASAEGNLEVTEGNAGTYGIAAT